MRKALCGGAGALAGVALALAQACYPCGKHHEPVPAVYSIVDAADPSLLGGTLTVSRIDEDDYQWKFEIEYLSDGREIIIDYFGF